MAKRSVDQNQSCIEVLNDQRNNLKWLAQLRESVKSIANFGCGKSTEAFALLWRLHAAEIIVIEKEKRYLAKPIRLREELKRSQKSYCLKGRTVEFIAADMLASPLRSNHFDLAYCQEVLYDIYYTHEDSGLQVDKVQDAINEMARVVKPGGWVIAVEEKVGCEFKEIADTSCPSGCKVIRGLAPKSYQEGDPINLHPFFEAAGLCKHSLEGALRWSYTYKKVLRSE
jgi:SAM-dependent methyltransferase